MQPSSVVGLFCEDIREEKSGQDTLIGILPDNMQLSPHPSAPHQEGIPLFPKLGLYVRIHLDIDHKPSECTLRVRNTDGSLMAVGSWDQHVIDRAFNDAKQNQMPYVGLIQKMIMSPLPIPSSGKIVATVLLENREYIAATLNVIVSYPTASAPPVLQSASGAQDSSSQT